MYGRNTTLDYRMSDNPVRTRHSLLLLQCRCSLAPKGHTHDVRPPKTTLGVLEPVYGVVFKRWKSFNVLKMRIKCKSMSL